MKTLKIALPDDLAGFVADAVAGGEWASADAVVAAALERLRADRAGTRAAAATVPDLALPPAVDTARQSFDGPRFMAELMDKLWAKK